MIDPSVEAFEKALCEYTGAPYAIAMKRCCIALKGCCEYLRAMIDIWDYRRGHILLPRYTYEFVPQVLVRSGFVVDCNGCGWAGGYQLWPLPVWDYARRFHPYMYVPGQYQCLSFHRSKILGHTEGGAVLTDDGKAHRWLRQWRDDGRNRSGPYDMIGESGLMYPDVAVNLTLKLHWIKEYTKDFGHPYYPNGPRDLPNSNYPDLSKTDWNGLWRTQSMGSSPSYMNSETKTTNGSLQPGGAFVT